MSSILVFAGSNSSSSINYQFAQYTASTIESHEVEYINMATLVIPMYSEDVELEMGFPHEIMKIANQIKKSDAFVIGVNEHNSNPSAFFKNLIDWLSRIERNIMEDKPTFLVATSPGKRGAQSALEISANTLPRIGASVIATFSLPSFGLNFEPADGITNNELAADFVAKRKLFLDTLA